MSTPRHAADPPSTRRCPECSADMPAEATVCPRCGTRLDTRLGTVMRWAAVALALFIVAFAVVTFVRG